MPLFPAVEADLNSAVTAHKFGRFHVWGVDLGVALRYDTVAQQGIEHLVFLYLESLYLLENFWLVVVKMIQLFLGNRLPTTICQALDLVHFA